MQIRVNFLALVDDVQFMPLIVLTIQHQINKNAIGLLLSSQHITPCCMEKNHQHSSFLKPCNLGLQTIITIHQHFL